jgi:hypothetical protein
MTPVFEQAKTAHALDRAATVIGSRKNQLAINKNRLEDHADMIALRHSRKVEQLLIYEVREMNVKILETVFRSRRSY